MQFEKKLNKYLKNKSETSWNFTLLPKRNFYDIFIIIPAKSESKLIPKLLNSIKIQKNYNLQNCLIIFIINNSEEDNSDILIDNLKSMEYIESQTFN